MTKIFYAMIGLTIWATKWLAARERRAYWDDRIDQSVREGRLSERDRRGWKRLTRAVSIDLAELRDANNWS